MPAPLKPSLVVYAHLTTAIFACVSVSETVRGQGATFNLIPRPDGYTSGAVRGVSLDGRITCGTHSRAGALPHSTYAYRSVFPYSANDFGLQVPNSLTEALAISGDGQAIAGSVRDPGVVTRFGAFHWNVGSGYTNMGMLGNYESTRPRQMSENGQVVVGVAFNGSGVSSGSAFVWTAETGFRVLSTFAQAWDISDNGRVIVGSYVSTYEFACTWTVEGNRAPLQMPPGGNSAARAVNYDGSVIVGLHDYRLVQWTNGSPSYLNTGLPSSRYFTPTAVSHDGSVIAGKIFTGSAWIAAVWTPETLAVTLQDYLANQGAVVPAQTQLDECYSVSEDGLVFVGSAASLGGLRYGYIATVPVACTSDMDNDGSFANGAVLDGAVTVDDLLYFLAAYEGGSAFIDLDNGTLTGTQDGTIDVSDLIFFLVRFEEGC